MKILAIDTSCDETAAAVTDNQKVLSNIIWSQAASHAEFGGVMPSLAQRMHEERIDFVVEKALKTAKTKYKDLTAIAVTFGPGLSIALGVGISKAKLIAKIHNLPLLPINHIEAHLLSPLATSQDQTKQKDTLFPAYGLAISGGNTLFVEIVNLGEYKILAQTQDDALGEALDKAARMLGLGYPGASVMEKMAKLQTPHTFTLPVPLLGQEKRMMFSYSGLKTSLMRYISSQKIHDSNFPSKEEIYNLSAEFQNSAFKHLIRTISHIIEDKGLNYSQMFLGGGVGNNALIRNLLRKVGKKYKFKLVTPYSKKLYGDNAAMIGVCAYLKHKDTNLSDFLDISKIDRDPRAKIA